MSSSLTSKTGVSLGMLRSASKFPAPEFPDWANTMAVRMLDMGATMPVIKGILEKMEIERRIRVRKEISDRSIKVPVTEFDEYLGDLLSKFYIRDVNVK